MDIKSHPEHISNLRKYVDNYNWSGLEFLLSMKGMYPEREEIRLSKESN